MKERGKEVVFLRRIIPGGADKSYGIHVAQLAGLPKRIIDRANKILDDLENKHSEPSELKAGASAAATTSMSLFESALTTELLAIDVMAITPLEAINILYRLQSDAKKEAGRI
ncbi:DNA mismatch repair protein MutS [bioreactor metagenome]|uniref:DNA mismatch repair protein MutS n=1 Tax=bioreactor metagenome TaxID=1076179 RepID=A0A645FS18_9ZZZZ